MAHALDYPDADRKSRYYYPDVSGLSQPRIDKLVWHSTETSPEWDCPSYAGGTTAPTLTINPWPGREKVWQHFPANMSAKALVDPTSTTVRENRDNVAQVEVIGYSQKSTNQRYWLGELPESGLAYLAKVARWYADEWGTPLVVTPLRWSIKAETNPGDPRYSGPDYDAFRGHLGHRHVSGNQHWDPSLDVPRIIALAKGTTPTAPTGITAPSTGDLIMALTSQQTADFVALLRDPDVKAALSVAALSATYGDHSGDGKGDTAGQIIGLTAGRVDRLQAEVAAVKAAVVGISGGLVTQAMLDQAVAKGLSQIDVTVSAKAGA